MIKRRRGKTVFETMQIGSCWRHHFLFTRANTRIDVRRFERRAHNWAVIHFSTLGQPVLPAKSCFQSSSRPTAGLLSPLASSGSQVLSARSCFQSSGRAHNCSQNYIFLSKATSSTCTGRHVAERSHCLFGVCTRAAS